jgi:uncharacterized membrane protein YhaH (DUF805 family)
MSVPLDRPYYGASWGSAISRFFANYAIFRGRASRSEYWWWALTNVLIGVALNAFASVWGVEPGEPLRLALPLLGGPTGSVTTVPGVVALVYTLGTLLPGLALTWRRLHDSDHSGGWFFIVLIPLVGPILLLVLLVSGPQEGGRRFD